jgi:hypothetical protein
MLKLTSAGAVFAVFVGSVAAADYSSNVVSFGQKSNEEVVAFSDYSCVIKNAPHCDIAYFGCNGPWNFTLHVLKFGNEELARWLTEGKAIAHLSTNRRQFLLDGWTIQLDESVGLWGIDFISWAKKGEIWSALAEASTIEITVGTRKIHIVLNAADKTNLATVAKACMAPRLPQ